jgi:hypothetical protein
MLSHRVHRALETERFVDTERQGDTMNENQPLRVPLPSLGRLPRSA